MSTETTNSEQTAGQDEVKQKLQERTGYGKINVKYSLKKTWRSTSLVSFLFNNNDSFHIQLVTP